MNFICRFSAKRKLIYPIEFKQLRNLRRFVSVKVKAVSARESLKKVLYKWMDYRVARNRFQVSYSPQNWKASFVLCFGWTNEELYVRVKFIEQFLVSIFRKQFFRWKQHHDEPISCLPFLTGSLFAQVWNLLRALHCAQIATVWIRVRLANLEVGIKSLIGLLVFIKPVYTAGTYLSYSDVSIEQLVVLTFSLSDFYL